MPEPSSRLPVRLLVALALSAALGPLNSTMVAVALPEMSRTLPADSGALRQALVTSYLLTNIVLQSPGGKLGDRLGHRRALGLGQLLLAAGAALAYIWPVLPALSVARIVMAAGGAILAPSATALLRTELPPELRGRAFGAFGAVMGIAAGTGPTIGAQLVGHFGWTSIFLVNVPVLLLAATLAHLGAPAGPQAPAAPRSRFDLLGSILLGAALAALVLGLERTHLRWAAVVGALGFVPFVLWERRVADPVVDFSLFKQRAFVGGSLIIALQNFAMYSTIFELPQVAGRLFHVGPRDVGAVLLSMMGTMVLTSPFAGRGTDRFGARAVALVGCSLALAGTAFLALRPLHALSDAIPALVMLGAGLGLSSAPSQSAAMSDIPREKSGMAAGLTSTMRYIGGVAGLTVLGLVLTDRPASDVVMHEHTTAMSIYGAVLLLTLGCALLLPGRAVAPVPLASAR
ncbi:MFS transporter [Polyangium mundeleinium]|uniref:MFS transporter n=1 Tax=Polyangium mundeleinium TaxID=2995306 RepID=A0ABT5ESI5_9BACT|nr:MFS transporter [Polyangium mundeleinium]MDC0744766.1 MFS transporter [Polyangium mundeleinium]